MAFVSTEGGVLADLSDRIEHVVSIMNPLAVFHVFEGEHHAFVVKLVATVQLKDSQMGKFPQVGNDVLLFAEFRVFKVQFLDVGTE